MTKTRLSWRRRLQNKKIPVEAHWYQSSKWGTCAVGEAHRKFPDVVKYCGSLYPSDRDLRYLGSEFHGAVSHNRRSAALRLYNPIQTRVQILRKKLRALHRKFA